MANNFNTKNFYTLKQYELVSRELNWDIIKYTLESYVPTTQSYEIMKVLPFKAYPEKQYYDIELALLTTNKENIKVCKENNKIKSEDINSKKTKEEITEEPIIVKKNEDIEIESPKIVTPVKEIVQEKPADEEIQKTDSPQAMEKIKENDEEINFSFDKLIKSLSEEKEKEEPKENTFNKNVQDVVEELMKDSKNN